MSSDPLFPGSVAPPAATRPKTRREQHAEDHAARLAAAPPIDRAPPEDHTARTRPVWTSDRERPAEPDPPLSPTVFDAEGRIIHGTPGDRMNPPPAHGGVPLPFGRSAPPFSVPYVLEIVHFDATTGYRRARPLYFHRFADVEAAYTAAQGAACWIVSPYGIERGFESYARLIEDIAATIAECARKASGDDPTLTADGRAYYRRKLSTLHGLTLETEYRELHPGETFPGLHRDPFQPADAGAPFRPNTADNATGPTDDAGPLW